MKLPIGQSDCRQVSKFLKISIRGEPEKKSAVGKPKTRKDFQKERGNPTFQVEFRNRKGQQLGLLGTNQYKFL